MFRITPRIIIGASLLIISAAFLTLGAVLAILYISQEQLLIDILLTFSSAFYTAAAIVFLLICGKKGLDILTSKG